MPAKIYIASPLSAPTQEERLKNMLYARRVQCQIEKLGYKAVATQAWLPMILDDSITEERELALQIGQRVLKTCDALVVAGEKVSRGMLAEIATAKALGIPVYFYTAETRAHFSNLFKEEVVEKIKRQ